MKKLLFILGILLVMGFSFAPQDEDPMVLMYTEGTTVTLKAVPGVNHIFGGWTGDIESTENPVSFVITRDMEVTAHFFRVYTLRVNVVGVGSVVSSPDPVDPDSIN